MLDYVFFARKKSHENQRKRNSKKKKTLSAETELAERFLSPVFARQSQPRTMRKILIYGIRNGVVSDFLSFSN